MSFQLTRNSFEELKRSRLAGVAPAGDLEGDPALGPSPGLWGDLPGDLQEKILLFLPLRVAAKMAPISSACRNRLRSRLSPQQARLLGILGTGVRGRITVPQLEFLFGLIKAAFQGRLLATHWKAKWSCTERERTRVFYISPKGRRLRMPIVPGSMKVELEAWLTETFTKPWLWTPWCRVTAPGRAGNVSWCLSTREARETAADLNFLRVVVRQHICIECHDGRQCEWVLAVLLAVYLYMHLSIDARQKAGRGQAGCAAEELTPEKAFLELRMANADQKAVVTEFLGGLTDRVKESPAWGLIKLVVEIPGEPALSL